MSNAGDPELRIDYTADPTRAGEVVNGEREMQREILQERIGWRCAFAVPVLGSKLRRCQPRTESRRNSSRCSLRPSLSKIIPGWPSLVQRATFHFQMSFVTFRTRQTDAKQRLCAEFLVPIAERVTLALQMPPTFLGCVAGHLLHPRFT